MTHILAPAKLNLTLDVLHRRPDGYHEIASVFLAVTLADRLTVARVPDGAGQLGESSLRRRSGSVALHHHEIRVTCEGFEAPSDQTNTAYQAAHLSLREFGLSGGCDIHIEKRIPPGGGLGGGSSDAAAVIQWLADEAGIMDADRIATVAAKIGSDVPFFLGEACALVQGRGEILHSLPMPPPIPIVIIYPSDPVSTKDAYSLLTPSGLTYADTATARLVSLLEQRANWRDIAAMLANDFETAILPTRPDIAQAKDFLIEIGALGALMTGSGAAVFGLFDDSGHAESVAEIARVNFGWAQAAMTKE